jgi:diaminohydroxyphosphoribosylaminopyrimidine deaminase/5-amino-6-(5-phosphoribosylamino)uracil reductase
MQDPEKYMFRCCHLALTGEGRVAPNPLVGAVLVYEDQIIGEGYHTRFGAPHAEVECLQNVPVHLRQFIPLATLYVNLEPCCHFGKTPPCTDLIIQSGIRKVVLANHDPFPKVQGGGIRILRAAGIEVVTNILAEEGRWLNRRFFSFQEQRRPYIILKWAQTQNGIIGLMQAQRLIISNEVSQRRVHTWRSEEAAILVGYRTALADNPSLTTRLVPGNNPVRLVVDPKRALPGHLQLFQGGPPTVLFNQQSEAPIGKATARKYAGTDWIKGVMDYCLEANIQSVLVEGGAATIQAFISSGYWNEIRRITNTALHPSEGVSAPILPTLRAFRKESILDDQIEWFLNPSSSFLLPGT